LRGNYVYEISDFNSEKKGEAYRLDEIVFDIPITPSAIVCTLVNTPKMLGEEARKMLRK
jgi:hypothetical protein